MAMHPSEFWILLAAALFIGGCGGSLIGYARAARRCCDCCTCDDCEPGELIPPRLGRGIGHSFTEDGTVIDMWHRDGPDEPKIYERRHAVVLEPGQTYPGLVELAQQAPDGSQIDAERPDTSTWLRTNRLWMEDSYPIPGTPQWEARQTAGVS